MWEAVRRFHPVALARLVQYAGGDDHGAVRQSANAQSVAVRVTTPPLTPLCVSDVLEISVALLVSRLAGLRPGPGSDAVFTLPEKLTSS